MQGFITTQTSSAAVTLSLQLPGEMCPNPLPAHLPHLFSLLLVLCCL